MFEKLNISESVPKIARQESAMYSQDGVRINDALWYHESKEYPGQIGIHLFPINIEKGISGGKTSLKLYTQGLQGLAHQMETDQKLAEITHITGWSKLVYDYPNLLKLLGFEITDQDEEKKEALAIMNREDFLKRYGAQKNKETRTEKDKVLPLNE